MIAKVMSLVTFGLLASGPASVQAAPRLETSVLPFPEERYSLETLSRAVTAVYHGDGRVIVMPERAGLATVWPYQPTGQSREESFGPLSGAKRLPVVREGEVIDWRGIDRVPGRVLLLDGERLALVEADPETLRETVRRSVPWDLIKPPADRGGEPTTPETAKLRQRFKRGWLATLGLKAVGMAPLPEEWMKAAGRLYVVALRVKDFPLVIMECTREDPSSCQLQRQCYVEGAQDLDAESVTGVAVSPKRRLILVGDRKRHRLVTFGFDTCYHVPRRGEIALPPRLKELTNLQVDQEDRLWVTTRASDDYWNASLYVWPAASW